MRYLEIPLILKYKIKNSFSFYAGAQYSYLIDNGNIFDKDKNGYGYNIGFQNDLSENWFIDFRFVKRFRNIKNLNNFLEKETLYRIGIGYQF